MILREILIDAYSSSGDINLNAQVPFPEYRVKAHLLLTCSECDQDFMKVPAPFRWGEAWSWGMRGVLEEVIQENLFLDQYRLVCPACHQPSFLSGNSVQRAGHFIRRALAGMPHAGPDWAKEAWESYRAYHLSGHPSFVPNNNGRFWLARYCGCPNCRACTT